MENKHKDISIETAANQWIQIVLAQIEARKKPNIQTLVSKYNDKNNHE